MLPFNSLRNITQGKLSLQGIKNACCLKHSYDVGPSLVLNPDILRHYEQLFYFLPLPFPAYVISAWVSLFFSSKLYRSTIIQH